MNGFADQSTVPTLIRKLHCACMHTIKVCCLNTQLLLFHSSCCASYWWSQQHGCCNCDNAIKSGNVYNKMILLYWHSKRQYTWLLEKDSRGTPHLELAGSHKLNHFKYQGNDCHSITSLLVAGTGFQRLRLTWWNRNPLMPHVQMH